MMASPCCPCYRSVGVLVTLVSIGPLKDGKASRDSVSDICVVWWYRWRLLTVAGNEQVSEEGEIKVAVKLHTSLLS